jgi:Phosphotransferase enzyme family
MIRIASAHERYREHLEALPRALKEAGLETWTCMHERFEPDREAYATCVLTSPSSPQRIVRVDALLGNALRLTPIPPDPRLPALATLLAGPGRSVVRYHPGLRCTIRLNGNGGARFAKIYAGGRWEVAHACGLELWRASSRGELAFSVAEPKGFDPERGAVWQAGVEGEPVKKRLEGHGGAQLARRIGRAAGSLTRSSLRPGTRRDLEGELARTALRCAELERRVSGLGEQTSALLRALEAVQPEREPDPRPIHGALHPAQWLENGSGLALLDYDSLALGDPELDAATFLADLDVLNRDRVPVDLLTEGFVAGYEESTGPLDPRLLASYRAQRLVEKALRVARAIRPEADRKAARRLNRALECLGSLR